jgi:hypothetical protein
LDPRRSSPSPRRSARSASVAASGESHNLPRANHFMTASGWRACICFSVGSSSSCVAARNAVGWPPMMIVQYV